MAIYLPASAEEQELALDELTPREIVAELAKVLQVENPDLLRRVRDLGIDRSTGSALILAPLEVLHVNLGRRKRHDLADNPRPADRRLAREPHQHAAPVVGASGKAVAARPLQQWRSRGSARPKSPPRGAFQRSLSGRPPAGGRAGPPPRRVRPRRRATARRPRRLRSTNRPCR